MLILLYELNYRIGGIFRIEKISRISCFRKIINRKQIIYMVHTLFLTDSQKFNPAKYTTYTVYKKLIVLLWSMIMCIFWNLLMAMKDTIFMNVVYMYIHYQRTENERSAHNQVNIPTIAV